MRVKREGSKRFSAPLDNKHLMGFTLTELLVVIIVIAVLTAVALPTFRSAVRHSRDKEAKSMLRLIAQSEEMYKLESEGYYVDCSDTSNCNNVLDLSIASGASAGWSYKVSKTNPPSATFTATATPIKTTISNCDSFYIKNGDNDPTGVNCK